MRKFLSLVALTLVLSSAALAETPEMGEGVLSAREAASGIASNLVPAEELAVRTEHPTYPYPGVVTCYATNNWGALYYAYGYNRFEVQQRAVNYCAFYSGAYCWPTGCRW